MGDSKARRKLVKLIEKPDQFFRDSKLLKAVRVLRGEDLETEADGLDISRDVRDISPRQRSLKNADLKAAIAERAAVFFIDDDSVEHLTVCTVDSEFPALISSVLALCDAESLQLAYYLEEELVVPGTVRRAVETLQPRRITLLRLTDKRSSDVFFVEIQAWKDHGDHILGPKPNAVSLRVWMASLKEHRLPRKGSVGHLNEMLAAPIEQVVQFDVDFVYTWVDSNDPEWQKMYAEHRPHKARDATSLSRFYNRNELMFSLRSLAEYAPWIRRIHIVSNCRAPSWLNVEHPMINWVTHEQLFDPEYLPTFSSHAIECCLHKIPGLANHFVYSNDDFLLTRPAKKSDFFEPNGLCKLKLEGWGSVNGEPKEGEPDYLNGARNSQRLLERDFSVSPTQLHSHSPQALRVDILEEMEARYPSDFEVTMSAKFRAVTDVAVTAFLFHHYAYVTGRAIKCDTPTMLIQQNHAYGRKYASITAERENFHIDQRHLSICVNDGADSHLNERWGRLTSSFLTQYFCEKSEFER